MAPPKPAEMKSTNRYTVKELARRAQKTGFEAVLEKSKRALKQAE